MENKINVRFHLRLSKTKMTGPSYTKTIPVDCVPQKDFILTVDSCNFVIDSIYQSLSEKNVYSVFANIQHDEGHPWAKDIENKLKQLGWEKNFG